MTSEPAPLRLDPTAAATAGRSVLRSTSRAFGTTSAALKSGAWMEATLLAIIFLAIVAVRASLIPWASGDYNWFLSHWSNYLKDHGFSGLGDQFADYNMPYLYLLYLGTLVPVDSLTWVKFVGGISDIALAMGCAALLRSLRLPKHLTVLAAAVILILPEVLLNSAAWGQADSTYSALVVWAIWAAVRRQGTAAWVLFALAFAFKLQAAFLLPVFVVAHISYRWRWRSLAIALGAALLTEVPAVIAGRSPLSLAEVYLDQTGGYHSLTLNAPSVYAFLTDQVYAMVRPAGLFFAIASVGIVSVAVVRRARTANLRPRVMVLFAVTLGSLVPFTVPQMHERYFYLGNVLLFVLALTDRRLLPIALGAQVIAVMTYTPFLLGNKMIELPYLALGEAVIVFLLVMKLLRACDISLSTAQLRDSLATDGTKSLIS